MRMVTKAATSGTIALGLLLVATPAHADHVVELKTVDGRRGTCTIGGLHLGLNFNIDGTAKKVRTVDGVVTGYTCTFTVPRYVSDEDNVAEDGEDYGDFEEFRLPKSGLRIDRECWADRDGGLSGGGTMVIKGNGKGSITCTGIEAIDLD